MFERATVYKYELLPAPGDDGYTEWVVLVECMDGQRGVVCTNVFPPHLTWRTQLGILARQIADDLRVGRMKV